MFSPYSDRVQTMLDHSYSKQESIKISEAMDTPYNQRYEQKLLIYSFSIKIKEFQEQWDQTSKQQEEELQHLREKYHDKQQTILIEKNKNYLLIPYPTN